MSLSGALNAAISSLYAQSQALSNISDNLANSGTTAYKSTSTSFSSLFAGSGNSSSGGVSAESRSHVTEQGLLVASSSSTDLAIEGDGFFVVSDAESNGSTYYTRNGEFEIDSDGYLTNDGYYLMGWATNDEGEVVGGSSESSLVAIDIDSVKSSVEATTDVDIQANLPADADVGDRLHFNGRAVAVRRILRQAVIIPGSSKPKRHRAICRTGRPAFNRQLCRAGIG